MKLSRIKRETKYEKRYSVKMGELTTQVTYIKRYIMGLPIRTLHKYRETYYGEVKDCKDCNISA
ncbi:hypothetical protein D2V93_16380 [Flagellimonas taeanensis]|jgi:hypothetical protein|uniref:Uncharacterized protein n=1 Tax=Flagellimonas taeanensis TaxID=1005926 RepID=A0A1M6T090_9FLAO|nr:MULTISPECIES: hypothetical protein [Allomuricauda]MDC6383967.1 hypothetical protein [Muricauda sp. SK9]MEE1961981.1 hypothetical protein [Allomuricauda taeanensis]RIV48580.1 hypothetical protein D2V93_16380 [Allomuricauda taeanensis]SFB84452.1 hypothetical protein SAMN04487891_1037 [Allomuricauda taeanensis]SHK50364.1 hypothetical protein SAMN05216293_1168 [Allomuricauda taeanensis]